MGINSLADRRIAAAQPADPAHALSGGPLLQGQKLTAPQSSSLHFSTDAFAPHEIATAWCELYGRAIARLELEPIRGAQLFGEATLRSMPGLGIASVASTQLRFRKPRNLIDNDDVILMIVDSGSWSGTQMGREVQLGAGDAVLCTNGEAASGAAFGRRVMLRVSSRAIAPSLAASVDALISRRIPREVQGLAMLRQYLRVMDDPGSAASELQRMMTGHICDLLILALGGTRDASVAAKSGGGAAARLLAIKDDIMKNLENGDLSASDIAARHHVTPRYLQKLFEREGTTFSEYVVDQRLAYAHRMLSDPRRAGEKIVAVAFAAGFGDMSYFYRVFRRRYGLLPTDVRASARRDH